MLVTRPCQLETASLRSANGGQSSEAAEFHVYFMNDINSLEIASRKPTGSWPEIRALLSACAQSGVLSGAAGSKPTWKAFRSVVAIFPDSLLAKDDDEPCALPSFWAKLSWARMRSPSSTRSLPALSAHCSKAVGPSGDCIVLGASADSLN